MQVKYYIEFNYINIQSGDISTSLFEIKTEDIEFDGVLRVDEKNVTATNIKLFNQPYNMLLAQKDAASKNNKFIIKTPYQTIFSGEFNARDCEFNLSECYLSIKSIKHVTDSCDIDFSKDKNFYEEAKPYISASRLRGVHEILTCTQSGCDAECLDCYGDVIGTLPDPTTPLQCGNYQDYFLIKTNYNENKRLCCVEEYDVDEQGGGCYDWEDSTMWYKETIYARVTATTSSTAPATTPPDDIHNWEYIGLLHTGRHLWRRLPFSTQQFPQVIPNGINLMQLLEIMFGCHIFSLLFGRNTTLGTIPSNLPPDLSMYEDDVRNDYQNLMIHQIGDVLDPTADELSSLFKFDRKTLIKDLEHLFGIEIRPFTANSVNYLQIEHKNWFKHYVFDCVDIIEMGDSISFDSDKNLKSERWQFSVECSEEWKSNDLWNYTNGHDERINKVTYLSTDVAWIHNHSDTIEKNAGYVLVACAPTDADGNNYIIKENVPLSFPTLINNFHRWNRPSGLAKLEDGTYIELDTEPLENRDAIGKVCCEQFSLGSIVHEGYTYQMRSGEWNIITDFVKLKLKK